MRSRKPKQWTIFPRGGARRGAGRKPKGDRPLVTHRKRPHRTRHDPVLITTRLLAGLPNLRRGIVTEVVREALLIGADRFGFRMVEYSVQRDHLHLIAEADDERALSRGMQGLLIRIAKRLNRAWERRGSVFRDRYHAQELESPRHVRYALVYVLQNARKHREIAAGIDPLSSGPWFRGWLDRVASVPSPLPIASAWLLTKGWMRAGLLATTERPALSPPWT